MLLWLVGGLNVRIGYYKVLCFKEFFRWFKKRGDCCIKFYVFLLVVFFKIVVNVFIMKWIIIIVVGVFVERLKCLEVDVMILVLVKFWY